MEEKNEQTEIDVNENSAEETAKCSCGKNDAEHHDGCCHDEKGETSGKKCKGEGRKAKAKVAELESALEAEKAKSAELNDKFMRVSAEYDNFRRRSKEERDMMYSDAVGESVKELLPIIDNLKLAAVYDEPEKIADGVKLILKTVPAALEKLGVEEFGAVGDEFNPEIHNAVMHEESEELGENVISAVLQCGYRRGDKILRFAMVKVAN